MRLFVENHFYSPAQLVRAFCSQRPSGQGHGHRRLPFYSPILALAFIVIAHRYSRIQLSHFSALYARPFSSNFDGALTIPSSGTCCSPTG